MDIEGLKYDIKILLQYLILKLCNKKTAILYKSNSVLHRNPN